MMTCGISIVDKTLNKSFAKLGRFIGNHPGYFVIIPVLLTFLCATGYQQIQYEIDPEYLFSPIRGDGKTERAIIENFFEVNYTHRFNVGRITRPGRFGRVIVTTKDRTDDNMITREVFQELRMLDQLIQNTTAYYDGEAFTYTDICARWEDDCFQNDILNLDYIMDEILDGTLNVTFPVMFNPKTWDAHAFPVFFGGTRLSDSQTILSVPAIQMVYFVTANTKRQDAKGAAWEEAFLEAVGIAEDQQRAFKFISIARFASRTLDHELERNTRTVVPYFASTFILMAGFSIITCMMGDSVRSKPWLGFFGNISALMATVAAFGFAMYLGIEFIGINLAAPFLMIGIGIDDTFVMLAAWRRTSCKLPVPERMAITLSEAAVSITITSLTDMVSFWIGIFSPFPSVQIFCAYSGFAVCFTFVWHITFFAGCMAISGYCEERNLHSIFGFKVQPVSVAAKENRSWFYRKFITGGINRADPDNPLDNKEHMLMGFFRTHVADFINNRCVKVMILIIFGLYLMGAGYGVTKIKEGLERRKLSKADSYSVRFFDLEDEYYREFPYRIQVVITSTDDQFQYSNETIQEQIEMLVEQFENTSYVTSSLYTESWLRSFLSFYDRNEMYFNETINTEPDFIGFLKENWLFPSNPYSLDVKFNQNNTHILASRFLIQAVNITDTNHEKEMVKDLRQICLDSPLNVSVFHPYFVFFDQFELVRPTSIQNMIVGGIVMMIIAFIFIPNLLCSLWVAFSILSIELGVVGYMSLWSVNLDSISMINLIMCIGFSVDFTAHICYTYMSSKARLPADRVREALYSLGMPIVQGSISTILGCMGLLLADSYIFLVFFKMIFLVIFFGALHGLFLLPVLLSLFGPGSCCSDDAKEIDYDDHDDIIDMYKRHNGTNKGLGVGGGILTNNYTIPHPQLKTISNSIVYGGGGGGGGVVGGASNNNNNKSFHQMLSTTNNANGNILSSTTKQNNLSPYHKAYVLNGGGIIDEKDLGIGTSGEDSSESSSHNSQQQQQLRRLQAIEDANTLRRYEEGWRKTSNDNSLVINDPIRSISRMYQTDDGGGGGVGIIHDGRKRSNGDSGGGGGGGGSGERALPIKKLSNNSNNKYKMNDNHLWMENDHDLLYRPLNNSNNQNINQSTPIYAQNYLNKQSPVRRKSDENYHRKYYPDDFQANYYNGENTNHYNEADIIEMDAFNQIHNHNHSLNQNVNNNNNNVNNSKRNIYDKRRRFSDEKRTRKYTPPELLNGIYQPNPNRSSSQHNLYYPRQLPFESSSSSSPHDQQQQQQQHNPSYRQRSSSQTSLHKLKHMGDIPFP